MNSATDWRTPKMSANTRPAAAMIQNCRRLIGALLGPAPTASGW
jgi:hypothetical protein